MITTKNYLSIYAKSFNWSGFFLPKKIYFKCSKLYDFCRTIDNIADQNIDLKIKKKELEEFKIKFEEKNQEDSVIKNMWDLMNESNISKKIVDDLFDGVESDLKEEVRIKTEKELLIYSYRVAGTVGLMMAKILGVKKKESLQRAIDLGIAMQLTNIARDVVEDKKMNRQYIKPDFEDIEATLKLADMFYESSFSSIKSIPLKYRFAIIVARRVYRQIGRKILNKRNMENYEKSGKIYVNNFGKIFQTFLALFDFLILFLKNIEPHQRQREYEIISEDINLDERI